MKWTKTALKELEKAPEFVRDMARKKVEQAVGEKGGQTVSLKEVRDAGFQGC